jgi:hypothetical protein
MYTLPSATELTWRTAAAAEAYCGVKKLAQAVAEFRTYHREQRRQHPQLWRAHQLTKS